jgi:hypothetical protein
MGIMEEEEIYGDAGLAGGGPRNGPSPGLAHVCRLRNTDLYDFLQISKQILVHIWT